MPHAGTVVSDDVSKAYFGDVFDCPTLVKAGKKIHFGANLVDGIVLSKCNSNYLRLIDSSLCEKIYDSRISLTYAI